MKYFDTIIAVNTLFQWKKTIMELRGPHPTEDSEIMLCRMVEDIIRVNVDMEKFRSSLVEMIYMRDLNLIHFNSNDHNSYYNNNNNNECCQIL